MLATTAGGALAATAVVGAQVANQSVLNAASAKVDRSGASQETSATDGASSSKQEETEESDGVPAEQMSSKQDDRGNTVSRSTGRTTLDQVKQQEARKEDKHAQRSRSQMVTKKAEVEISDPRALAREMLAEYGWGQDEFSCLEDLWIGESNWDVKATNPTSGAYGIPQALPAEKMASAGSDWRTNAATQIEWGLGYIQDTYGSPCAAQSFKSGHNWY